MQFEPVLDGSAFLAMGLAVLATMVVGFVWYHPKVFGTAWGRALGIDMDQAGKQGMGKAMGLMLLGAAFTAFVFWVTVQAFTPDAWLHDGSTLTLGNALLGGFYVWLGFKVPVLFGQITWEGRPNRLFVINGGYHLVQMEAIALIYWAFLR